MTALDFTGAVWILSFLAGFLGAGYIFAIKAIPRESGEMQASSDDRITYWKTAINMTVRHPIFATGISALVAPLPRSRRGAQP